MIRSTIRGLAV